MPCFRSGFYFDDATGSRNKWPITSQPWQKRGPDSVQLSDNKTLQTSRWTVRNPACINRRKGKSQQTRLQFSWPYKQRRPAWSGRRRLQRSEVLVRLIIPLKLFVQSLQGTFRRSLTSPRSDRRCGNDRQVSKPGSAGEFMMFLFACEPMKPNFGAAFV